MSNDAPQRRHIHAGLAGAAAVVLLLLPGCTSGNDDKAAPAASPTAYTKAPATVAGNKCGPASGVTLQPGTLTISTDTPANAPWFEGNDPGNGRGFEGAVIQAVSQRLGYKREQVAFRVTPFKQALAAGAKPFDFAINQATITSGRREHVDFSSPYYAVTQAVVALKRNRAAQVTTLAGLSAVKVGAVAGTTSFAAIGQIPRLAVPSSSYPTIEQAKAALTGGQIDALVTDIPNAFQLASTPAAGAVLVGQLPRPNDVSEFLGLILRKDSPLTACVSAAVDSLYADGTLDQLARQWLADTAGAKILQ